MSQNVGDCLAKVGVADSESRRSLQVRGETLSAQEQRKGADESPAPFAPFIRRVYLHCMQGSPLIMIGPQVGADATPSWGGLYWRCSASFGPPIDPHATAPLAAGFS